MRLHARGSWLAVSIGLAATGGCSSSTGSTGSSGNTTPDGSASDAPSVGPDAEGMDATGGNTDGGRIPEAGAGDASAGDAAASGPVVGGCPVFPADYPYNQNISQAALDPGSATYIANLVSRAGTINPPTSPSEYINIVPSSQTNVTVQFGSGGGQWGFDTSDTFESSSASTAPAPIPSGVVYENMNTPNSDHHMMVVVQGSCRLFELYAWNPSSATSGWEALVTWNLDKNEQLPDGWGSTTAAGTPLLAGIIRYDEVAAGEIPHAIDIVISGADLDAFAYVKPAARSAGACGSAYPTDGFPYGGRLRLKASFDTSAYTGTQALVIARALKKYGMINTDDSGYNRADFRLGPGNWDTTDLSQLKLTWDDFEVPTMTLVQSKACN
ncbi:MAG TPA: hypothetical protein VMI75_27500 [Polyangiaceae bacterium]|nr:hypothetical protein [Polyangiaceae bacterium]